LIVAGIPGWFGIAISQIEWYEIILLIVTKRRTSAQLIPKREPGSRSALPFLEGLRLAFDFKASTLDAQLHHLQDPNINHDRKPFVFGDFDVTLPIEGYLGANRNVARELPQRTASSPLNESSYG
jgi:hypothetical protein